jgi:hypothetical protein
MITCSNCATEAKYNYSISDSITLYYCSSHLPNFLSKLKNSGQLNIPSPVVVEPPKTTKSSKKTTESTTV